MKTRLLSWLTVACVVSFFAASMSVAVQGQDRSPAFGIDEGRSEQKGHLIGVVTDALSGDPLVGVHLYLVDKNDELKTAIGAISDEEGNFQLNHLSIGDHRVEARMLGFVAKQYSFQITRTRPVVQLNIQLEEEPVMLSEIVVKPAPETFTQAQILGIKKLSADQINQAAAFDEDIYRTMTRTPGLSATDFSSRFTIRGGEPDQVLVMFDGLELNDPFHLKDFGGGGMSIIDSGVIGEAGVMTGAFPATYGDRLSGVFQMRSKDAGTEPGKLSLALSMMNARVQSQGVLQNQKTSWIFSGRRGYLDKLLELTNSYTSYSPKYHDAFGKISHRLNTHHEVAIEGLLSKDHLTYQEVSDPDDQVLSVYGNKYGWVNWEAVWSSRLYSQTVVATGAIDHVREGVDFRPDKLIRFKADDRRSFKMLQVKQDWTLDASESHLAKWGFSLKKQAASYFYENTRLIHEFPDRSNPGKVLNRHDKRRLELQPEGALFNLYTSHQLQLNERLLLVAGGRFGYASWSDDKYIDPRLRLSYRIGPQSVLNAGWGHYHQPQGIEQLYVPDGDAYYYGAERSRHLVLGFDHQFEKGVGMRIDLYRKRNDQVRPRYVSPAGEVTSFFPERDKDRLFWLPDAADAHGIEFSLSKDNGRRLNGWFNYTLSSTNESLDGVRIAKGFDQRHAVRMDVEYRPWSRFRIYASWQYHTGWRYSDVGFEVTYKKNRDVLYDLQYGAYNGERFPNYHKLDLRISQVFRLGQQSLIAFLEVRNLYNRENVRLYRYEPVVQDNGSVSFDTHAETWLPRLPAFGLKWDVGY